MLQNKLNLAIANCALANEGEDLVWNGDLAETLKNINNVFSLKPNGDSSVEGVWSEAIFVDGGRPADGLSDCNQEVLSLFVDRGEALQQDQAAFRDPEWAIVVIFLQCGALGH